jgi:hypothetical protein
MSGVIGKLDFELSIAIRLGSEVLCPNFGRRNKLRLFNLITPMFSEAILRAHC